MAHERHHAYIQCQFGNRGDILEHQELLSASPAVGVINSQAFTPAADVNICNSVIDSKSPKCIRATAPRKTLI
jgi:hypothetical protein